MLIVVFLFFIREFFFGLGKEGAGDFFFADLYLLNKAKLPECLVDFG